jgi:hypothetical protein
MNATKVQVKIYAENLRVEDAEQFVPVFHRWIRDNVLDEMVIDVADYTHVPEGPGVVLVGHGSDYYVDLAQDRPGLLYSRKRALPEGVDLLEDGLRRALNATRLLAAEPSLASKPVFGTQELLIRIPDRLHAQNDDESFARVRESVSAALARVFPEQKFDLSREGDVREPLTIRARAQG